MFIKIGRVIYQSDIIVNFVNKEEWEIIFSG